jgi:hypothetical protein
MCASVAVQVGQLLALLSLLPALIWLVVAPRQRAAQVAVALAAGSAAFTALAVLSYRLSLPSWLVADVSGAADVALITAVNIVVATSLAVRHGFLLDVRGELPLARLLR